MANKYTKQVFLVIFIFFLFIFSTTHTFSNIFLKGSMLKNTVEWGRLAEIPDSARDLEIYSIGNMFTSGYECTFYLSEKELKKWMEASPGIQEGKIYEENSSTKKYSLKGDEDVLITTLTVDFESGHVRIYHRRS